MKGKTREKCSDILQYSVFYKKNLSHANFKEAKKADEFLVAKPDGAIRNQADFQKIKKLTLTLSRQLTAERYEPLFAYLSGISHLEIRDSDDSAEADVMHSGRLLLSRLSQLKQT